MRESDCVIQRHSTELGELPADWRVVAIDELQPFITSGSRGWATYYSESGSTFLRITNLSRECIYPSLKDLRYVEIPPSDSEGIRTALRAGDILISITADIGIVGLVTSNIELPAYVNQHIALVRIGDAQANARYLAYFLAGAASQRRFKVMTDAGAKAGMNLTGIRQVLAAFPPTSAEQHAIAEALSDADALIESLLLLLSKKRQIKQGVMQELLTGKKQMPGFSDKWECKRLGEIAAIEKGQLIKAGSLEPGEVPVIAGGKKPAYFHSKPNRQGTTITVSASGASAGYVALHRSNIFASDCSTISESHKYCIDFLFYALLARQGEIYATQTGGAQPHVQPKDLARLNVWLPRGIDEQATIAAAISDIDAEIEAAEVRLSKARNIKSGMMQALLTGRIRLVQPSSPAAHRARSKRPAFRPIHSQLADQ